MLLIVGAVSSERTSAIYGLAPGDAYWYYSFIWIKLQQNISINGAGAGGRNAISVVGNTAQWYLLSTYEKDGSYQCNDGDTTYAYIAIG